MPLYTQHSACFEYYICQMSPPTPSASSALPLYPLPCSVGHAFSCIPIPRPSYLRVFSACFFCLFFLLVFLLLFPLFFFFLQDELFAIYNVADVCLVTSVRDGMNLVSHEYVAAQSEPRQPFAAGVLTPIKALLPFG